MKDYYHATAGIPKPPKRSTVKAREKRQHHKHVADVRAYVFARENGICRCCGKRSAESMHEILPRSLGGTVSHENSIALCGSGTTGCHGLMQQHHITVGSTDQAGADGELFFVARTAGALAWVFEDGVTFFCDTTARWETTPRHV